MTQALDMPIPDSRVSKQKLVLGVCFAHFVSHYYITLLAPLFVFIRQDYAVSYTDLGLALTAFNVASSILQTPTGFLVDRMNARLVIVGGLLLGAAAFAIAGLINSFWVFVAMFAVAGIGNTVYHPADYTLLARHVPPERAGRVFSYHTFSGMIGNAAAPPTLVLMYGLVGWRGAFYGAAALGVICAIWLLCLRDPAPHEQAPSARKDKASGPEPDEAQRNSSWQLLMSPPILLNLVFFILLSFCGGGLTNYLVVALGALYGTPLEISNAALTALLIMGAVGVLVGGMLTGWTSRHALVASCGLIATATVCTLLGLVDFNAIALVLLMSVAGFFSGMTMPSRDMIVRGVTPPGAFGRVFGFVSTGFNIAGIVSPLIFGQLLDHGYVREMFFFMAVCALLAIGTIGLSTSGRKAG